MNKEFFMIVPMLGALAVGVMIASQASVNAHLARFLGSPVSVSFVSLLSATVLIIPLLWVMKAPIVSFDQLSQAPWWAWLGGVFGMISLTCIVMIVPKIGVGAFTVTMLAGQILMALAIDHFGLFDMAQRHINGVKLLGVLLVFSGVVCVQFSDKILNVWK